MLLLRATAERRVGSHLPRLQYPSDMNPGVPTPSQAEFDFGESFTYASMSVSRRRNVSAVRLFADTQREHIVSEATWRMGVDLSSVLWTKINLPLLPCKGCITRFPEAKVSPVHQSF